MSSETEFVPSVIKENSFSDNGMIESKNGYVVPAYIGSQLGFHHPGRMFLSKFFYPALGEAGVFPLCPFDACSEFLDGGKSGELTTIDEWEGFWSEYNEVRCNINYKQLMPKSKIMIALLEGDCVDSGLCAEVAHFAQNFGPVVGIRTDVRMADNLQMNVNPALRYFIDKGPFNGHFFCGEEAYSQAFVLLERISRIMRQGL